MGQTGAAGKGPSGPASVGVAVLAAAAAVIRAADPILDSPDAFWHWDLGRRIIADGLPRTDPYSFLTTGREWVLNQWGAEAIFGVIDAVGGLYLLAVVVAVLTGGVVWLTGQAMLARAPGLTSVGLTGLVLLALIPGSTLRGNLFTLLLLPVLLRLLRQEQPSIWLLVALFVVWANLHAAFLLGGAILLIHWIGRLILAPVGTRAATAQRGGILVGVSLLASLVSPYGHRLLASSLSLVSRGADGTISEWGPTQVTSPTSLAYTLLVAIVLVSLAMSASREDLPDILVVVAVLLFGYSALRNMGPAALVVAIVGAPYVHTTFPALMGATPRPPGALRRWEVVLAGVMLLVGALSAVAIIPRSGAVAAHAAEVPLGLAEELDELDREARVVAPSAWGPVVAAITGPHVRIAVDGRLELFTDAEFEDQRAVERAAPMTPEILARWCATDVIASTDSDLHVLMDADRGWTPNARTSVLGDTERTVEWFTFEGDRANCPAR